MGKKSAVKKQKPTNKGQKFKTKGENMKKIQRIILAFMLGIVPIQSALADSKADALFNAAQNGKLEQVKTLIEKEGVDINARESEIGATALIGASFKGHLEVVQYLINKGADINAKADIDGRTALMVASMEGHLAVVKALVEGKKGLLSMFSKGADINAKDNNNGVTALMEASSEGHLEVVKYLINKGADINAKDSKLGGTALIGASTQGHLEVVKYLINKGADINTKVKYEENGLKMDGITALIWASMRGHLEVVKYLVNKGANINAVATMQEKGDSYSITALDFAQTNAIEEVLKNAGAKTAKEIQK